MMREAVWPRRFAAVCAFVVGAAAIARADVSDLPRHRVGLDLGVGSAVGAIGLTYNHAFTPMFRGEAGVGWGWSGVQLSVMPKVALHGGACAFTSGFGAALALGGPSVEAGHGPAPWAIPWLNFDALGVECPTWGGLSASAALGLTMPLRAFHYDFSELGDTVKAFSLLPQGRVSLGWWF
jgi:hypothetical protein